MPQEEALQFVRANWSKHVADPFGYNLVTILTSEDRTCAETSAAAGWFGGLGAAEGLGCGIAQAAEANAPEVVGPVPSRAGFGL